MAVYSDGGVQTIDTEVVSDQKFRNDWMSVCDDQRSRHLLISEMSVNYIEEAVQSVTDV